MISPKRFQIAFLLIFFLLLFPLVTWAQEDVPLRLRLNRDWGYDGGNGRIQGTFSLEATGPDSLSRVVFLLDGEALAEDEEAPFEFQFDTGNYPDGIHTFSAVGYTADNQELQANEFQREFLSGAAAQEALTETIGSVLLKVVLPILLLVAGGNLVVYWMTRQRNRTGKPAVSGVWGGTICPKCGRPFALHWWKLNMVVGAFDRCPHCGRWSLVNRIPESTLQTVAEALEEKTAEPTPIPLSPEEKLRKQLEESRFDS